MQGLLVGPGALAVKLPGPSDMVKTHYDIDDKAAKEKEEKLPAQYVERVYLAGTAARPINLDSNLQRGRKNPEPDTREGSLEKTSIHPRFRHPSTNKQPYSSAPRC